MEQHSVKIQLSYSTMAVIRVCKAKKI